MTCIRVFNVWKIYSTTTALAGVSVEACKGLTVVMGPNGSGKSTLLKLIAGLAKPTRGRVETFGLDPWRNRSLIAKRVSTGFESTRLPWWMKGWDILQLYSDQLGLDVDEMTAIAERLGLARRDLARRVRGYSMGMRKKLLLAASLASGREAYLLDEPYTLLDPGSRARLDEIIAERAREAIVIVASHFTTPTLMHGDRLVYLEGGRIAAKMARKTPARAYACKARPEEVQSVISRAAPRRVIYEEGFLTLYFEKEVDPPAAGCKPVLVPPYT